jgi:hypothetical protein
VRRGADRPACPAQDMLGYGYLAWDSRRPGTTSFFRKTAQQSPFPFWAEMHPGFSIRPVISHVAKTRQFRLGWRENAPSDDCDRKLKHAIRPHPSKINPESSSRIADLPAHNLLRACQEGRIGEGAGPPDRTVLDSPIEPWSQNRAPARSATPVARTRQARQSAGRSTLVIDP